MTEIPGGYPGFPNKFESPNGGGGGRGIPSPDQNGRDDQSGNERNPGDEAEARRQTRKESLPEALIASAENPEELYRGLRLLEKKREDSLTPANLEEKYTPPRILDDMKDRAEALHISIEEMIDKGWISDYNPITGEATLNDTRLDSLAVKVQIKEKGFRYETKYFFGTNESRQELEAAYQEAIVELEARDILNELVSIRMDPDIRDGLEYMVRVMHGGRTPKFKPEHLEALFNLRGYEDMEEFSKLGKEKEEIRQLGVATEQQTRRVAEIEKRQKEIEGRTGLGDQLEEGLFLNLIMLNCGSKQRMLDFMDKPGYKFMVAKLAKEKGMTYEEWEVQNVGKVREWDDDTTSNDGKGRILTDDGPGSDEYASWRRETMEGKRGAITQYGNIAAYGGAPAEFNTAMEKDYIENVLGGLIGSSEAAWLACMVMRGTGTYASEGYVALPNGKTYMPLGEGRFITGDDAGKFHVFMFNKKEGYNAHTSGLKDLFGRVPDYAINLFDWMQVTVGEEVIKNPDGTVVLNPDGKPKTKLIKRSIWDAWMGTAEQYKKDLLTGNTAEVRLDKNEMTKDDDPKKKEKDEKALLDKQERLVREGKAERTRAEFITYDENWNPIITEREIVAQKVEKENYHKLGELRFTSAERDFHVTFTIMQWLMGNAEGPTGVFVDLMDESFRPDSLKLNANKKRWKYIRIIGNQVVLTGGSTHLFDFGRDVEMSKDVYDLSEEGAGTLKLETFKAKSIEVINRNVLRNILAARILSSTFVTDIMPQKASVYNTSGVGEDLLEVPLANLVRLYCLEVFKPRPTDEAGVIDHYIDDLARLQKLTSWKSAGKLRIEAKRWLTNNVGRVIGRRTVKPTQT